MKSRISIDFDHDNQPVIRIEHAYSDDVRDKLVKKFIESFNSVSSWALFSCSGTVPDPSDLSGGISRTLYTIRPIGVQDLEEQIQPISQIVDGHNKTTLAIFPNPKS